MRIVRYVFGGYFVLLGIWTHFEAWSTPYLESSVLNALSGTQLLLSTLVMYLGIKMIFDEWNRKNMDRQM